MLTFAALWCAQYIIGDYKRCANQEFWSRPAALDLSSPFRLRILNGSSCPFSVQAIGSVYSGEKAALEGETGQGQR
jgi:hypothetical protein